MSALPPKSGHRELAPACPLCVMSGLLRRGKRYCYSITSSARASTVPGMVMPSSFAVARLMKSSNFVGCSIGNSPGCAPEHVRKIWTIRYQASGFDVVAYIEKRRQSRGARRFYDAVQVEIYEGVFEGERDVLCSPNFRCGDIDPKRAGQFLDRTALQQGICIAGIGDDRQVPKPRHNLAQEFKSLARKLSVSKR